MSSFFNYNSYGHMIYTPGTLKSDSKIINIDTKRVGSKGSAKYRTTFTFDDGFKYVSHKTRIENHLFYNHLSLSKDDIAMLASMAYSFHSKMQAKDSEFSDSGQKEVHLEVTEPLFPDEEETLKKQQLKGDSDNIEDGSDNISATNMFPVSAIFSVIALIVSIGVMSHSLITIENQEKEIALLKQELVEAKEKLNELPKNSIDNMDELKEEVSSLTLNKKIINSRLDSLESTVDFLSDHYLYNK